jgi:hypothetical protein
MTLENANVGETTTTGKLVNFPTAVVAVMTRINALAREPVSQNLDFAFATKEQPVGIARSAGTVNTRLARPSVEKLGTVTGLQEGVPALKATTMVANAKNHAAIELTTLIGVAQWINGAGQSASSVGS